MWGCNEKVPGGADMTSAISVKDRVEFNGAELKNAIVETFTHRGFNS